VANNALSGGQPTTLYASLSSATAGSYGSFEVPPGAPVSTWSAVYPFTVLIDYLGAGFEAVAVTGPYTGTGPYTFPCIRGADGTAAGAHTSGAAVVPGVTAQDMGSPSAGGPPDPSNMPWLSVDNSGPFPVVRQGAGGAQYRATGYNFWIYYPPEGATITQEQMQDLMAQLRPGSLIRTWAYAPNPSSYTWASAVTALQQVVAAGKRYGHRFIFTLSTWGDVNELYNATGQTDTSGNVKEVAWITAQRYLHSVYGANSLQDWVTLVCETFAAEPSVAIYDIMNEPEDATTTNVTAWATYCSTMSGWIKAIAPGALAYIASGDLGDFIGWGNTSQYATVVASMDFTGWHDYGTSGISSLYSYDSIAKPQLIDEYGAYAKGHYGAYTDSDLDSNGLPAMTWEAQARYTELYLETVFRSEMTFAALYWSLMDTDPGNGPYGDYDGTGQYEPLNQARTRKVIRDYPVYDHPYFNAETIGGSYSDLLAWINGTQAFRYPDGSVIYSGANALQQNVIDMGPGGQLTGPSSSGAGPVVRHKSVLIRGQDWPSLQFSAVQFFADSGSWADSGSATYFFVLYPTALPTGSGSTTFGYLIAPATNVTDAAIRITSTGAVVLEKYSAATGGTVVATSTALLTANSPALVMVSFASGSSYRIDVNTVVLSGSTATTFTAPSVLQFGAAADGTNGFSGHLLELIKFKLVASEAQVSTVNAYLTRKYGLQS